MSRIISKQIAWQKKFIAQILVVAGKSRRYGMAPGQIPEYWELANLVSWQRFAWLAQHTASGLFAAMACNARQYQLVRVLLAVKCNGSLESADSCDPPSPDFAYNIQSTK